MDSNADKSYTDTDVDTLAIYIIADGNVAGSDAKAGALAIFIMRTSMLPDLMLIQIQQCWPHFSSWEVKSDADMAAMATFIIVDSNDYQI